MIEWADIPLHIRCTNRHLIDPTYPGNLEYWYKLSKSQSHQSDRMKQDHSTRRNHRPKPLKPMAVKVLALIKECKELTFGEIRAYCNTTEGGLHDVINALTYSSMIWEGRNPKGRRVYGILDRDDDSI